MRFSEYILLNSCINACKKDFHAGKRYGLTLVEMVIALSLITIIFASIVPIFGHIRNNWESKQAASETIQNGRVLMDHIQRNLSEAVKIIAVSDSSETDGYIEFENNFTETQRYDINSTDGYVEFGSVSDLFKLAGPVNSLKFTCFDPCDLDTPITDVNLIRFIKIETTLINPYDTNQNKTLSAAVYLQTNGNSVSGPGTVTQTAYDYSNRIQGINIFAYDGEDHVQSPVISTTPIDMLSSNEYEKIEYDDEVFYTFSAVENSKYGQMRFVIKIDENWSDVTQIKTVFNGIGIDSKKNDSDGLSLFIWNYTLSQYELLEASTDTEDEITIGGTLTESLTSYIGGAALDTIILLVATNGKKPNKGNLVLMADYVKLEITANTAGGGIYP